jgi:hypothetical protein
MTRRFETIDATRGDILIRAGFCGPAGSGKTWTALRIATIMAELLGLGPVWLIDSENRSSLKYAYSQRTGKGFHFKTVPLPPEDYSPTTYMDAIDHCESQGAKIIIVDSLSQAWNGTNGVLEQVDRITKHSRSKNAFTEGWREMTPVQNQLIQRILRSPAHMLLTFRAKVDWVMVEHEQGKKAPNKVGMAPIQREGVDYEPDLMFDLSVPDNRATVSKTRCDRISPRDVFEPPGLELALRLAEWALDTTLPRTTEEALAEAVEKGVVAATARGSQGRQDYIAAREDLARWCRTCGVTGEPMLARFKAAVAARLRTNDTSVVPVSAVAPPGEDTGPMTVATPGLRDASRPGLALQGAA